MRWIFGGLVLLILIFVVLVFLAAADCQLAAYICGGFIGYLHNRFLGQ